MKSRHFYFLCCVLFLVLAAVSGCEKSDPGKYVYANFITLELEDPTAPGGDADSNPNVEHDILLIITSPPSHGTHLHWTSRMEGMEEILSWPAFLAQCHYVLKEMCGVILPPLDGVSPAEFKTIFEETMTMNGYGTTVSHSSTSGSNQGGHYRSVFDLYKRY